MQDRDKLQEEELMPEALEASERSVELARTTDDWVVTRDGRLVPGRSDSPMNLRRRAFS